MNGMERYGVTELSVAELAEVNGGGWFGDLLQAIGEAIVYDLLNSITEALFGYPWF